MNFPGNGKFQNPKFLIPTSQEERLARLVKLALKAPKMAHCHAINAIFSTEQSVQAIFLFLMVT